MASYPGLLPPPSHSHTRPHAHNSQLQTHPQHIKQLTLTQLTPIAALAVVVVRGGAARFGRRGSGVSRGSAQRMVPTDILRVALVAPVVDSAEHDVTHVIQHDMTREAMT